jgi:hypothetical protein
MKIDGIPEGVECVRIGQAKTGEFEAASINGKVQIFRAVRQDSLAQIIVVPADGYDFIPAAETPNNRRSVDATTSLRSPAEFDVVKKFPAPVTIGATLHFQVLNSRDVQTIDGALEKLKELPGFVGTEPAE